MKYKIHWFLRRGFSNFATKALLLNAGLISLLFASAISAEIQDNVFVPMLGFATDHASSERALEKKYDAQLNPAEMRAWLEQMSAEPNHVGSPHDKANADFMLEKFREWGWDAHLEVFYVLYPTPKNQSLELVAPTNFLASLHEPPIAGDRTSGKTQDALPPYHAYGADGDVTGELVYVNAGMPDDYKELDRHGITVKGRIVIARYSEDWRGIKPKLAYEHGAIGCIVYSDPGDDGYALGDVYPKGAFRPAEGVQRGSVADMPVYPGDPLTPGVGATKEAKRLSREEAKTILKIPVMPISYADAQPLLAALEGPVALSGWRGGLPITYKIGPGPAKVHLTIASDWSIKPIYDVIATIKGSVYSDQWVIRGNHHDGWVFGAWDPLSANVSMLAEAKAIGTLVRGGWKPKRTIVFAGWDGEEPGLLGSTEWVETHAEELRKKIVLYLNSDTNGRGFLKAGGSHSFQSLVNEIASELTDPQTGVTVLERRRAKMIFDGVQKEADDKTRKLADRLLGGAPVPIKGVGAGSDYTAFLHHLGVASMDIRYGGEEKSEGVYHSIYDSFDHYDRFGDPGFVYGVVLASTIGRVMLRVADADVLPHKFGDFADTVAQYVDEVHKLADSERETTERDNRMLDESIFKLAADPTETYISPPHEKSVPFLNFAPLDNALGRLKQSAKAYDEALTRATKSGMKLSEGNLLHLNELLQGMEQTLIYPSGLPGRDWYRHMIYAPGLQTGYGVKTLPGVREAIEERNWPTAEEYVTIVAHVLNAYAEQLDKAAYLLK